VNVTRVDETLARPAARPEYFEGRVRMQELYQPTVDGVESEMLAVFFDAGARTTPHTHEGTQILHVVSGRCVFVDDHERRIAGPGEIVVVPPGVWHWHGAAQDGPACHVSVKLPGRTDWTAPRKQWAAG
jgi:quercetin dioxygenase-like cupin family protein